LRIKAATANRAGDMGEQVLRLSIGQGASGEEKLRGQGITIRTLGNTVQIAAVRFGSEAAKLNLAAGDEILTVYAPAARMNPYWLALPAYGLIALIFFLQVRRRRTEPAAKPAMQAG
jgi:hypothetical protein